MARPRYTTLRTQLVVAIIPLVLLFMAFNFFVILPHEEDILRQETDKRANSLAAGLAIMVSESLRTFSDYLLPKYAEQFSQLKDVAYIVIADPSGRVLAHTDPSERGKVGDDPASLSAINSNLPRTVYTDYRGIPVLDVSRPILVEDERKGTVRVGLRLDSLDRALARSRRYLTGLTMLLLAGSVVFMGVITRHFTDPLLKLALVSRELARGRLSSRAPEARHDEVGLLGRS
ncbi:MAG: HAMP domain-containing protein, partial [Candidatus Eremiobacterota bacterium]